jgi:hypothetical protein
LVGTQSAFCPYSIEVQTTINSQVNINQNPIAMKTITYIYIIVYSICLLVACDVTETGNDLENEIGIDQTEQDVSAESRSVNKRKAVPFKATFSTIRNLDESGPDPEFCGPNPAKLKNVQDGYSHLREFRNGNATHLGKFTTKIIFCMDVSEVLPTDDTPGQLTEGESIPYENGIGTFTAANGDKLYFTSSGAVLPSSHPDYDFEFQDPFTITGGTGRFEGATGSGMTDSLVDFAEDRTDHKWTGSIKFAR